MNNYPNGYNQNNYNQNSYNQNNYNQNSYNQNNYSQNNYRPNNSKGYAIASMVCGICSILTCWCYGIIGLICGVCAIAFYFVLKNKRISTRGMATAGLVCGIIGTALSIICLVLVIIGLAIGSSIDYMGYY